MLVLLPGLGTDRRLFEPQASVFPQLIVPPWIEPVPHESLSQYAARLAKMVTRQPDCPLILGGMSLGDTVDANVAAA